MEEKIFIPQSNLSFDIQRFAELIDGQYTLEVTGITVTCYFTGITGDSVEVDNNTVTIGGKTFTASNASEGAEIRFTGSDNAVTAIEIKNVAVTTDNVIYTPTGSAGIAFGDEGISLSGTLSTANSLNGKIFNTQGNITLALGQNDAPKIDNITYKSELQASINVTADTITLVSGTIAVGANAESLSGKNFVVNADVTATFNLQNSDSVTINDIVYKAKNNAGSIMIESGYPTLNGNFEISLAQGQSVSLIDFIDFKADTSAVKFTYNSVENNCIDISGELKLTFAAGRTNATINVGGVTYSGKTGNVTFTDSIVTLDGDFTVGNGTQSLSEKNFTFSANSSVVLKLKSGDSSVIVNGVTYSAGSESLTLQANSGTVTIYGKDATVSGTGNFVIANSDSAANINGVKVTSTNSNAAISFGENNTVQSLSSINVGDANLNLAADATISNSTFNVSTDKFLTLGGVTYSGTGAVTVNSTNSVTLSGTSMNVTATDTESLKGKNIAFTGEVKINGDTYSSSGTNSGSVSINSEGTPTVSNSSVEFDENTPKTLSINQNKKLTVDGVTYTAKNSSAQVEVKGTAVKITNGTVAVENTAATYTVDLDTNATAQIGGVNFQKTSDSNSDADIHIENGNITLNAGFNVGDGNTPLNLTVTLTTSDQSTFNLGGGNVTVIQNSGVLGDAVDVTENNPYTDTSSVTYSGTGTVSVTNNAVTLSGGNITVTNAPSNYTFTLSNGTFTFGNAIIDATGGTVNNVSVNTNSITVGSATYSTASTVNLTADGSGGVSMTDGTYTEAAGSTFTIDGDSKPYTSTSAITYSVTDGTESVLSASGTRAYETGENITKNDGTYNYDVTAGTYSVTVTSGTGTATLTGDAQKIFTAGQSFSYNSHIYEPIDGNVTYNISFNGDTINEGTKSGSGTRNDGIGGTYEHNGDNAGTYTLSSGAIMKLTFGETPEEEFYSGSATLTTNSYNDGTHTYTSAGDNDLTYTLTKSNGGTPNVSFTGGTGTRSNMEDFTYPPTGSNQKSYNGDVTYTFTASDTAEKLYAATSATSTNVSGDTYAVGNNTYNLTAGTYSLTFSGGNTNVKPTLTSGTGTTTKSTAFTIKDDSKEYTPLNGSATLTLNYDGTNETESFTGNVSYYDSTATNFNDSKNKDYTTNAGITYSLTSSNAEKQVYNATGTRAFGNGDTAPTFDYQGNNYTVTEGTYTYTVTNGTRGTAELTTTTAVFTTSNGDFKYNSKTYKATAATTFTLNSGNNTPAMSGKGTRTVTNENKNYTSNKGNVYNTLSASTYQIDLPTTSEYLSGGSATKTVSTSDSFKVNGQTYKPKDADVTLTLSFSGGEHQNENETVSGNGTRSATEENSFTYGTKTYSSTNIVKITENGAAEVLYSATGTRSKNANETYTYNEHTYTLTSGTFNIDVDNKTSADGEYLTSGAGNMTTNAAFTISGDSKEYTPLNNGNATLTLTVTGKEEANKSESFTGDVTYTGTEGTFTATNGNTYTKTSANITYKIDSNTDNTPEVYTATGTRAFGEGNPSNNDSATDTYNDDTYKVTAGTYSYSISNGTLETETLKNSTATYSIGAGTSFHFGTRTGRNEYTAIQDTKLTLGYNANGTASGLTNASGAGTRKAVAADSTITVTESEGDTYNTNAGATIKGTISGPTTINDTFLFGTATYTTSDGTFHANSTEYKAIAPTTITYNKANENATPTKTFSSGSAGTRTAAGTETDTYSGTHNGGEYTAKSGAKIKWTANAGTATGTETFYSGSATLKTNSYTLTDNKEYTSAGATDLTLTWSRTNGSGDSISLTGGTGTREDNEDFVFGGKTYTLTSDEATYTLAANESAENLYAATGTRSSDANDTTTGQWGNTYSFPNSAGTVKITVSSYSGTPQVIDGTATETYTKTGTKKTFKYSDKNTYTANRDVTLKLVVSGDGATKTETFESGSAQNGNTYIVKTGSQVDIGADANKITYTATGDDIVTVTAPSTGITALSDDSTITGAFTNGDTATIGGITYKSTGATSLDITDVNTVTANGTFEATGDFSTARTLNSATFNVTGDTDVKVTFGTSGVTKIENLSANATVVNAGGATTAITDGNGTFIFKQKSDNTKQQSIQIQSDTDATFTFTLNDDGLVTDIKSLNRDPNGAYVKATITETDGKIYKVNVRRTGDDLSRQADGSWTDTDIVNFYYVTYENNKFTVKAVDKDNKLVNITSDDYTENGTTLTFKDETKNIIVENKTDTAIKVGKLEGDIKHTNGNVIRIDTNGEFKLGTFNTTTFTFNESFSGNFDVSEEAEFTVDDTGKITVTTTSEKIIDIEAPTNANIHINTAGTFKVNGVSILQIENASNKDVELKFDSNGNVSGIKANGAIKVTVMPTSASSFDLGESADKTYVATSSHFQVEGSNLTYVTVLNDYNSRITYETDDNGNLTALSDIDDDAIIILDGDSIPNALTINGHAVNGIIAAGKKIKLNSTTANYWYVEGNEADAIQNATYRAVINADNTISLYSGSTQTKNVKDYEIVFGSSGPKPTKDDGDLPTYPSGGITIVDNKLSELEINAQTSATYKINNAYITIPGRTILKPVDGSFSSIEVDLGAQPITYNEMNFTGNGGTSKATLGSAITLATNAKVTNVNGKTFTAKGTVTFDDVTVSGLNTTEGTAISGVTTNTNSTTMQIGDDAISVTGDKTYSINATTKKITGISNGAQVDAVGYTIETDSNGTFKFGDDAQFVVAGDDRVTFKDVGGAITEISDLSAAGSITGDFTAAINVNADDNAVEVAEDNDIGVIGGNGTVSKIYNVSGGAEVKQAGGAATISTDGNGTFTFGAKTYAISAGTADFLSSAASGAPAISGIKNVNGSATVSVYQAESAFAVNGNSITFTGNDYSEPLQLAMGGDTISTVEGLESGGAITGLSAGAVVKGTDGNAYTVNNKAIQITDSDFNIHASASGYASVTGIANNAVFNNVADSTALLIPNEAGTYTFGSDANQKTYEFDAVPTLKADRANLTDIIGLTNGQSATIYQNETGLKVGNDTIILTRDGGTSGVKLTMNNGNVSTVENLEAGDQLKGLTAGTIVKVAEEIPVKINDSDLNVDKAATVYAASGGYSTVTGVDGSSSAATFTKIKDGAVIIPSAAGTYAFGSEANQNTYSFDGVPTLIAGADKLASIGGLINGQSATIYQTETGLKVGNDTIILTRGDGASDGVKLTMNNGNVSTVENLEEDDKIQGLTAGTIVKTTDDISVGINADSANFNASKAASVYVKSGGYDSVTGFDAGTQFKNVANGTILIPTVEGEASYIFGDDDAAKTYKFSAKPILKTGADNALASIGGLSSGQTVELYDIETGGLYIGSNKVKLEAVLDGGTANVSDANKVIFTMGDNNTVASVNNLQDAVSGLSTGAIVQVAESEDAVKINNVELNVDKAATVYAASNGYSTVTGVDGSSAAVTFTKIKDGAVIIPSAAGTYAFGVDDENQENQKTYEFDAVPTLVTGADKLAAISGLASGQAVTLFKNETGLKVGKNNIDITRGDGTDGIVLTMGNDTISNVESMADGDAISGLIAGAVVKGTAGQSITVNTKAIQISSDSASNFNIYASANGYASVTGIAAGATFDNVADSTALLIPDAAGTFTFGDGGKYDFSAAPTLKADGDTLKEIIGLTADQSVTIYQEESGLKVGNDTIVLTKVGANANVANGNGVELIMNAAGNVATVKNLQDAISGLNSGTIVNVKASSAVNINGADLEVSQESQDVTAHVKDSTGYDYVTIKPGAEVTTGENVSFVTDGTGTFTFPDSHAFQIEGDTEVTIKTGDNSAVTEINGVASALIVVSHEESGLKINGKAVDVSVADGEQATLKVDANGVVEGIEGLTAGDDLPANITLAVDTTNDVVSINGKNLKTGQAVTVHTTADGYDWVSGIKDGANVEEVAENVSLVTDGAGTFTFGTGAAAHTFTTDDAQITLKTGEVDGSVIVTEIAGLDADKYIEFSQGETNLTVNGKAVTFTVPDSPDSDQKLKLKIGNNATIASVENLRGTISDLSAGVIVQVAADATANINTTDLQVDKAATVYAAADGYSTVNVDDTNTKFTTVKDGTIIIPSAAGTFTFGDDAKSYVFDAKPTLVAGASNALASIGGLASGQAVQIFQDETGLKVGNNTIILTHSDNTNGVKLTMGNGNVATVESMAEGDAISGLSAGAVVKGTDGQSITVNTKEIKITGSAFEIHAAAGGYSSITGVAAGATFTTVKDGAIIIPSAAGTFTFGDTDAKSYEFSAKPTLVSGASNALASIGGLASGQYVELQAEETALYIGANKIKLEGSNFNGDEVKFVMGDNNTVKAVENLKDSVTGLSAGALVQVTATNSAVGINGKELQTDDGSVTVHATANGYDTITGLSAGKEITAVESNAYIVTDGAGTFTFGSQVFTTDDAQITLKTGDGGVVTEIAGLDTDKYLKLSQDEKGLNVNGRAITVTGASAGDVKLVVDSNGLISKVENLKGDIKGLSAGALVQVAANNVTVNGEALETTDDNITVHATADGYDTVTGLTGDAEVTTAKENATIVTDAAGTFTFDSNPFTITDDNSVAFVMGAGNALAGVYELDGKISGDFTAAVKVDGRDVLITGDTAVDIYADGSKVTKIEGLDTDNAVVQKSGGAETISTGNGTYTFGTKKYNISAGTADFLSSGDVPVISGINIKNLGADDTDVEVTVYQNENSLTVGDNTLKLGGVDTTNGLKLTMNGDTISTVEYLGAGGEVSGLSAGANVHVATGEKVTINGVALQIDDSDFYVQTAANGYSAITGVAGNVTKAVNASIEIETNDNADTAEEFVFGSASNQKTYTINGDVDQKVTFVTDGNTSVTAVSGLNGSLKSSASSNKINGVNVYSSNPEVWFVATGDNGIASLNTVTDGNIISVPAGVEVAITDNNDATVTDFSINGIAYHLICETAETANTIYVKDKTVKQLPTNARLTISGAEGNYVVNGKELYITPGRNVVIGESPGAHLYDPDAVDFSTFTPAEEIIERVFGENVASTIVPVENGSSDQSPGAVLVTQSGGSATLDRDQQLAVVKAEGTVNISNTNDSVVAAADVTVDLTGSTNARLMQTAGTMTVDGYDYSTGAGIQISNADVIAAVKEKAVKFGDTLTLDNGATMKITYADEKGNIVNLYDITGKKKQTVYYANSTKAALTGDSSANVFVGSWDDGDDYNAIITGGSGNDTAFGGAGDFFNLGNGDNYLELDDSHSTAATVELTATSGNTTVKGFGSSDIVKLNAANAQVYYTAAGLTFTNANGQASLSIQDVTAAEDDGATGISYANVLIKDRNASDDASPIKTAVAREGMAIKVQDDGATAYVGQNSGIDLTALNKGDINLDTGNGLFTFTNGGVTDVTFRGITSIKGGSGDHELTGSATISNTLEAGTGACEIWGKGAANDLLIAADYTAENGKKASTFIFEKGDGNDTISNIQFYDSSDEAVEAGKNNAMDVVSISGSASTSFTTSGKDVIIKYTDTGDTMTIKDAVGKKFKVSSVSGGTANFLSVGKDSVTFDGGAGFYYAAEPNSSLVVDNNVTGTVELNGGGDYTIDTSITIIDASNVNGEIALIGNSSNNTLKAGKGESTLFGSESSSSNDLLIGNTDTESNTTFLYKNGLGQDTIFGAKNGDIIDLYDIKNLKSVKSIMALEYSSNKMVLQVGTGSNCTLTIAESNITGLNFKFKDGTTSSWDEINGKIRLKSGVNLSADLAEDYWENEVYANELLDGDADLVQRDSAAITFDNAENISYVDSNLLTGDIQFSVASGEQVYNFSALVDKRNK